MVSAISVGEMPVGKAAILAKDRTEIRRERTIAPSRKYMREYCRNRNSPGAWPRCEIRSVSQLHTFFAHFAASLTDTAITKRNRKQRD